MGSIPGSGRSHGEGNGNLLQYLAWKFSQTEEPAGLQSMSLQRDMTEELNTHTHTHTHAHTHTHTDSPPYLLIHHFYFSHDYFHNRKPQLYFL